jgi:hypothetical protein
MEDFTLPSVGASFKKWECCAPILPNAKPILIIQKKSGKKCQNFQKRGSNLQSVRLRAMACRRLLIAGQPLTSSHRLLVAGWRATSAGALNYFFPKYSSFLLPTYFCTCGQFLLVGFSTCSPCPDFS